MSDDHILVYIHTDEERYAIEWRSDGAFVCPQPGEVVSVVYWQLLDQRVREHQKDPCGTYRVKRREFRLEVEEMKKDRDRAYQVVELYCEGVSGDS